jgi:hypothetical protein
MSRRLPTPSRLAVTAAFAALVVLAPGWSTSAWASTSSTQQKTHTPTSSKRPALSGTWAGTYSGAFSGTFKLTWAQTGHNLSGTIKVSGFNNEPTSIHGTVRGVSISFGTVGSEAITYSGSVSGSSMSGNWKIVAHGKSMGGGSWSASKSS